jgi:hypothetical protein
MLEFEAVEIHVPRRQRKVGLVISIEGLPGVSSAMIPFQVVGNAQSWLAIPAFSFVPSFVTRSLCFYRLYDSLVEL